MKYVIRKFEGNFWVDVLEFVDARQLGCSDAVEVVREKALSGGLPFFGASCAGSGAMRSFPGGRCSAVSRSCTTGVRGG